MIKIGNTTNINYLEEAYKSFSYANSSDITIHKTLTSPDFGLVPAIIQFFATWFHCTEKNGKIIFNLKEPSELEEFYKVDYVFPVIVYCWERNITDIDGNDLKPALKSLNIKKHEEMKNQTSGGGQKSMLVCFDHLAIKKGLLNAFYTEGVFIGNEMEFDFAIDKSVRPIVTFNRDLRIANFTPFHLDLIAIIYELMKNTDDWARTDEFNKPLNPNSRGLFLKMHRRTRDSYIAGAVGNEGLTAYFSDQEFEPNNKQELYFLEISVYDTGIGFVKRNKPDANDDITTEQQVRIIKDCLIRNNTSAKGVAKTIKGQGLDRIMRILDNKGLFWLRTQNVSIFRNLRANRYVEDGNVNDIQLYDWFSNSPTAFSKLAATQGSIITLVYPLSNVINA